MAYQAQYDVAYEGTTVENFDTTEEMEAWLERHYEGTIRWHGEVRLYEVKELRVEDFRPSSSK